MCNEAGKIIIMTLSKYRNVGHPCTPDLDIHCEIHIVQGHTCKQRWQLQAHTRIGPRGWKPVSHWQQRQDSVILEMTETRRACAGHVSAYRELKGCNSARSPSVILLESNCSYLAIAWQVEAGLLGGDWYFLCIYNKLNYYSINGIFIMYILPCINSDYLN